jgi:apolipoprotein N-acyltransferase
VIWPESATPYPLEEDVEARRLIGLAVPPDGLLLTGGERFDLESEPARAWNSLFVLDRSGTIVARYDKRDLVPFGEFLPFRDVLGRLGLQKLTRGSFDFEPGRGRQTIALPGLPPFSPLICYEVIFTGRVTAAGAPRPRWLLNITNDAWFGTSAGPFQHFAMARLRTVEEGLPLVRAANSGISAVVDARGRTVARLGLNRTGGLDAPLPAPLATAPPYARLGLLAPLLLAALTAVAAAVLERRTRRDARS